MAFDTVIVNEPHQVRSLDRESFLEIPIDQRVKLILEERVKFFQDQEPVSTLKAMRSLVRR